MLQASRSLAKICTVIYEGVHVRGDSPRTSLPPLGYRTGISRLLILLEIMGLGCPFFQQENTMDKRRFVKWVREQIDALATQAKPMEAADADNLLEDAANAATVLQEAREHALTLGLADVAKRCVVRGRMNGVKAVAPQAAREVLAACLKIASDSPYLDTEQAADYLNVTVKALRGHVERGRIKPRKVGKELRFTRKMLDEYNAQDS